MTRLVNKIGPKKLKSLPFFDAQKVYAVRDETTAEVKIKASNTIFPVQSIWIYVSIISHITETMCTSIKRSSKEYEPSVLAQLTPTVRLRDAVNSPKKIKLSGCFC